MKKWLMPMAICSLIISTPAFAVDVYTWKPDPDKRFKAKDLNSDGTITKEEFLHPYNGQFQHIDANSDNVITKEEMRLHLKDKRPEHVTEKLWSAKSDRHFGRKDNNKDNIIDRDEFMHRHVNSFKAFDTNSDETISREEMRTYWETEKLKLEKAKRGDDD